VEEAKGNPANSLPVRLIGEVRYVMLLAAPRLIAEGLKRRLETVRLPVHLETPFALPEVYMGTYTGDVALWVPETLYNDAVLILERDQQGESE